MTRALESRISEYVQELDHRAADQAEELGRRGSLSPELPRSAGRGVFIALASIGVICLCVVAAGAVLGSQLSDATVVVTERQPADTDGAGEHSGGPDSGGADDDGASQRSLDERWDDWSTERIHLPAGSPLDQGRHLYLDADGGSMMLSLMPGVEIRSPQIDSRIDGHPVTVTEVPDSTAVHQSVAIGDGTIQLWSVDVGEERTREVLEAAVRSLGAQMDGELVLPEDLTLVSEHNSDSERHAGEAWQAVSPSGAVHQIGRVRIASPEHEHELAVRIRLFGARELVSDPISVWFTPQMDDPSIGTISWVQDGWRWGVGGLTDDVQEAQEFMAAAPHLIARS